jgi:DNA repair exonuclease SbcCD ATPase subunit
VDRIEQLNKKISEAAGRLSLYKRQRDDLKKTIQELNQNIRIGQASIRIILTVGEALQTRVSLRLYHIASQMLRTLFPDPYQVKIPFSPSGRGTVEAQILFERKGKDFRPVLPSGQLLAGGGPVETAAFGLRLALWAQLKPRPRPVFLLDEPFRFVQKDLQSALSSILSEISKQMGLQLILITHEPEIQQGADKIVEV